MLQTRAPKAPTARPNRQSATQRCPWAGLEGTPGGFGLPRAPDVDPNQRSAEGAGLFEPPYLPLDRRAVKAYCCGSSNSRGGISHLVVSEGTKNTRECGLGYGVIGWIYGPKAPCNSWEPGSYQLDQISTYRSCHCTTCLSDERTLRPAQPPPSKLRP